MEVINVEIYNVKCAKCDSKEIVKSGVVFYCNECKTLLFKINA